VIDLNTVFLGSGEFSGDLLANLYRAGFDIGGVITRPDRPAGRGLKPRPTPVKKTCEDNGLEIFQPSGPGDPAFIAILEKLNPELILVADYGYILPGAILEYAPKGCLNVHPSLLPLYRGADPIRRALIDGVKTTGVTLMLLDEGMDTGPIIARRELVVQDDDNAGTLREKLASLGADMLVASIPLYVSGMIKPEQQDEEEATYANPAAGSLHPPARQAGKDPESPSNRGAGTPGSRVPRYHGERHARCGHRGRSPRDRGSPTGGQADHEQRRFSARLRHIARG
jgi:methionyl-tRNA formyltransferase